MPNPGRILVPVDFSATARVAVDYAASLATALSTSITLLHIYELPMLLNTIVPGADNSVDAEGGRRDALRRLEELRHDLVRFGLSDVEVRVEPGSPANAIVAFARTGGFQMIVMGTHGRSGVARFLMGSVAELVVRRAECPVVTVHLPSVRSGQEP